MQNDFILIPWDSININHTWNNIEAIEYKSFNYVNENCEHYFSIDYIVLGLLIYNIIIAAFLLLKYENVLYRKNKAVE
jgi:hypothetical protein